MFKEEGFDVQKKKFSVELPKIYPKVLNISCAINETMILFGTLGYRRDCLTHFTKDGKILG